MPPFAYTHPCTLDVRFAKVAAASRFRSGLEQGQLLRFSTRQRGRSFLRLIHTWSNILYRCSSRNTLFLTPLNNALRSPRHTPYFLCLPSPYSSIVLTHSLRPYLTSWAGHSPRTSRSRHSRRPCLRMTSNGSRIGSCLASSISSRALHSELFCTMSHGILHSKASLFFGSSSLPSVYVSSS
jgi:hypothetical protein